MKKTFLTIVFLILFVGYIIFIHKQSEFVAGDYRYYTLYEEYQAKDKFIDYSAKAYEKDIYNLKFLKTKIISETEILDKYNQALTLYNDSINITNNSINDYNRYISNLKELKLKINYQRIIVSNFESDLNELDKYISKLERDILSIKMYKSEISNIDSFLKTIDLTTKKYNLSISLIQYAAATKSLKLEKEIQEKTERLNSIAEIERKIELEKKLSETYSDYSSNNYDSRYSSNNYISNYSQYEYTKSYDLPTPYYSTPSVSVPSSFYSTNTNPNHVQVDGHYKSNGTYVEPYTRTAPNSTIRDNFSTSPNLNPYTGKIGTIKY